MDKRDLSVAVKRRRIISPPLQVRTPALRLTEAKQNYDLLAMHELKVSEIKRKGYTLTFLGPW
jgi:hypothetical protein